MLAIPHPQPALSIWNALDIQVCKADVRRVDIFIEAPWNVYRDHDLD